MNDTEYHINADPAMHELLAHLEDLEDDHDISPELDSGILSIIMPDDKEYVINKHAPSKQIWVSSPYSGASYFEYADGKWIPKRTTQETKNKTLYAFIIDEIHSQLDLNK